MIKILSGLALLFLVIGCSSLQVERLDDFDTDKEPIFDHFQLFDTLQSLETGDAQKNLSYLVTNALKQIKILMREGNATYSIPQLDPFVFNELNFTDHHGLKLNGYVQGVLENLSDFYWEKLYLCLFSLTFQATFNVTNISLKGSYDVNGSYYDVIPIYGSGNYSFEVEKFIFTTTANFKPARGDQPITVELLDINIEDIGNVKLDFGDVFGGGELAEIVNKFTNDVANAIIQRLVGLLETYMSDVLFSGLQSQLNNVTIVEVIDYLNSLPELL